MRTFDDKPATREPVPLFVGLYGPSGCGKTYSALRLATGIQRVSGGEIFVIDTEAKRSLHYAELFKFRHVEFKAPFSPLDYLAAVEHCVKKGAGVIVVDSFSHEHEGPGGVLEWHEQEVQRLSKAWKTSEDKTNIPAWGEPKKARRKLINTLLQMQVNAVFCFRAKEKIKIKTGEKPKQLGWMPIAGEEFLYEMTTNALLPPGSKGVPRWAGQEKGEEMMIKLPEQFRSILLARTEPLNEDIGEQLARWAAGTNGSTDVTDDVLDLLSRYDECEDAETLDALESERKDLWSRCGKKHKESLKRASDNAKKRTTVDTQDEERAAISADA